MYGKCWVLSCSRHSSNGFKELNLDGLVLVGGARSGLSRQITPNGLRSHLMFLHKPDSGSGVRTRKCRKKVW